MAVQPDDDRDWLTRSVLTYTLAVILVGSVTAAWVFYALVGTNSTKFQHLETMVGVLITPVFSLFSAAVGFYYGERRGSRSKPESQAVIASNSSPPSS